jgi:hypothetical protein
LGNRNIRGMGEGNGGEKANQREVHKTKEELQNLRFWFRTGENQFYVVVVAPVRAADSRFA